MFGPLTFPEPDTSKPRTGNLNMDETEKNVPCILCEKSFIFQKEKESCLKHIFEDHHVVIGDADQIADFPKYLEFWKVKMTEAPVKEYCSTMLVDVTKDNVVLSDQEFFLLSDVDKDDKMIREKLQNEKIENALEQQRFEREDRTFTRGCFMCKEIIEPTRSHYVTHLNKSHNVLLGHPNNLIFLDKLFQTLDSKMDNLQCIFCEKIFKDRLVLKEHMRKKGHKRINPDNKFYDQFYIINYMGPNGTKWKAKEKREKKPNLEDDEDEDGIDWSDWEEEQPSSIICLFCTVSESKWEDILSHMKTSHNFDYESITAGFDFYKQVKIINYIRKQIYWNKCVVCNEMSPCNEDLIAHMEAEKHFIPSGPEIWDKPEYFFPTYENDSFLCHINDDDSDDDDEINEVVSETVTVEDIQRFKNLEKAKNDMVSRLESKKSS